MPQGRSVLSSAAILDKPKLRRRILLHFIAASDLLKFETSTDLVATDHFDLVVRLLGEVHARLGV